MHLPRTQSYPAFTGDRLYRVGVEDAGYDAVLDAIRIVETTAQETYYLVVTPTTGKGKWATRDYVDELY